MASRPFCEVGELESPCRPVTSPIVFPMRHPMTASFGHHKKGKLCDKNVGRFYSRAITALGGEERS